ncbi:biosynthetic-type acetolactate synthase large subunit [Alteromonas facilis]|uniref:biosynthetic-type acetolactate synthase large subunit n=1 Tax=Alteromonas facilis TaxID=2048004 RepID=UPI000C28F8DE|nr:biosynthetic-type acetolactate synthase large subunit [Alteromonas facilis]
MNTSNDNLTYSSSHSIVNGSFADIKSAHKGCALRGAELLIKALIAEGVEVVFGYPGGANLEIFDVLAHSPIRVIRTEHEQGAVHAAQGYARASGRVGVCLATSGPGATNLVTGIADANSDSTPIVAITGNVPTHLLGKNAFQEVDITAITAPITKASFLIKKVSDIPEIVSRSFLLSTTGRQGPVLIDLPKDIQQQYPLDCFGNYIEPPIPALVDMPSASNQEMTQFQVEEIYRLIEQAQKPVIYAGGGIVAANAAASLRLFAERIECPVVTTIMGQGLLPSEHALNFGPLGMHGSKCANTAVNEADLVLALGVRFDDRVTGNVNTFIEHAKIIHIDIDRNELNKNKIVTFPICADLAVALSQLRDVPVKPKQNVWVDYLNVLKRDYPFNVPLSDGNSLSPQYAISVLAEVTQRNAIVSLGVGQHQMWAMQHYASAAPRQFLSSSGFGTMGFGLPAAIGAKVAFPERMVIDIDGDGSFNMNVQELATCYRFGLGVKIVIINNQWLGMVRQWQDMIYDRNRSSSDMSDPFEQGDVNSAIYPDFIAIAKGYNITAERVTHKDELEGAYKRMLADPNQPYLLDVVVEFEENVFPMIPAGGSYKDIIMDQQQLVHANKGQQGSNI